jgi:hypothetical protein
MKNAVVLIVGGLVLIAGFQNCSKIGASEIVAQEKSHSIGLNPENSSDMPTDADPEQLIVQDDNIDIEMPDSDDSADVPKDCSEDDQLSRPSEEVLSVADANALCEESNVNASVVQNLNLRFNRKNSIVDVTAFNVAKVRGNHGKLVVIRASDKSSVAKNLQFNHSTVILCNFKEITMVHAVHSHLIVVGGSISKLKLTHSSFYPVNAEVLDIKKK